MKCMLPTAHPPAGYMVFVIPCRKRSRQHSQSVLLPHTFIRTSSTNCSPYGFASLHAFMPFALAASFLTAAPESCKHTSFSRPTLHCIALRSLALSLPFGED
jgi:hypothetical protein